MKSNNQLALVVAYYLSRGDKKAYLNLGYKSFSQAIKAIGEILGVKVNTIKNMRDEFDPYHDNGRVGWLRELRGSRLKVLRSFQEIDDETLLEIVKGILFDEEFKKSEEYMEIEALFRDKKKPAEQAPIFILRGPTGRKAETLFMELFIKDKKPVEGELIDMRDHGCGYDFEIRNKTGPWFVEVKGLADGSGGILFTNKEWQTAIKSKEKYFLVLVRNLSHVAEFNFIQNPAQKLKTKKNIYTTVQLNWSVSKKNLESLL